MDVDFAFFPERRQVASATQGSMGELDFDQTDISQLPRSAIIAFAARCARRIQPLLVVTHRGEQQLRAVENAIRLAEEIGAGKDMAPAGRAIADSVDVLTTLGTGAEDIGTRAAEVAIRMAHCAAYVALNPVDVAVHIANAVNDAANAAGNVVYTAGDARAAESVTAQINRDFEKARRAAMAGYLKDDTPVPPEFFGPMWPDGLPARWPTASPSAESGASPVDNSSSPPLTLLIQPGTATPQEIGELLAEISLLYRMLGGSGITFKLDDVYMPAEEAVPV